MDNSSNTSKRAFEKHNVKGIYDSITNEDEEHWIPTTDTLEIRTPRVVWKGKMCDLLLSYAQIGSLGQNNSPCYASLINISTFFFFPPFFFWFYCAN